MKISHDNRKNCLFKADSIFVKKLILKYTVSENNNSIESESF